MAGWMPGRWWRAVLVADGSVWCESSDEQEVRAAATTAPGGAVVQHQWQRVEHEWRVAE